MDKATKLLEGMMENRAGDDTNDGFVFQITNRVLGAINSDAMLEADQEEHVSETIKAIARSVEKKTSSPIELMMSITQLATYINSCR